MFSDKFVFVCATCCYIFSNCTVSSFVNYVKKTGVMFGFSLILIYLHHF